MAIEDLTHRQRRFVEYYLGQASGNASEAARLAGYRKPEVAGCRLLKNVQIRAAIASRVSQIAMSADEVLSRLADQASADMDDFITIEKGEYRIDLAKAKKRGKLHVLKALRPTKFGVTIELRDPVKALALLGKYHGLFQDPAAHVQQGDYICDLSDDEEPENPPAQPGDSSPA